MADDSEGKPAQDETRKTNKLVMRLLVVAIVIMITTPILTVVTFRAMSKEVMTPAEEVPNVTEVALPTIQVNVADTNATRYAQVEVVVTISDPEMLPLFQEQTEKNPEGRMRQIVASVIRVIGDKPLEALLPTEGKVALANEIKATLNDLLADYTSGMVTDVYFCGFLIQ